MSIDVSAARYDAGENGVVICKLCKRRTTIKDLAEQAYKVSKKITSAIRDGEPLPAPSVIKWKHDPGCPNIGKS